MPEVATDFEERGFYLISKIADAAEIDALKAALAGEEIARAERGGETFGARNLLRLAAVRNFATSAKITACLRPLLGPVFQPVRSLFFDKTEKANWPVAWHQDLSLALEERHDLPGWKNWTMKRGVTHVQPPAELLSRMITVRLHLDDCPPGNGPLRLIPDSHRLGILDQNAIKTETQRPSATITANAGDALLMRPLILHASSPAQAPQHRRVLHLEFAPAGLLPRELAWASFKPAGRTAW